MNIDSSDRKDLLKKALLALDEAQARLEAEKHRQREPIAVIGMGCHFPGGADSPQAYWELLRQGRDAIRPVPEGRWDPDAYDRQVHGVKVTWLGGFLDAIDQFDPAFFGLSPREAASMDPQQRLVLETGWEALENAGIVPGSLAGSATGVFIGITTNDYAYLLKSGGPAQMDAYAATGGALNVAAGRLAYTLGLQGPSLAVDTACSSSLVAIHLAMRSLRLGECNLAIAGGVNAALTPDAFVAFARWGMMAPDGRCKTFDEAADGFVRGEGCGLIVLKRLSDALAEGAPILAVLRGSAINQDGRSSGLTVPNGLAQQAVIRAALADAGAAPAEVEYVEAHGTGTALGDPIEVEALGAVFGEGRGNDQPLLLGSVKTNLGHLESASGIAGVIKVILSLRHEELPAHLHFQQRNSKIPWPSFPVEIPSALRPWPRREGSTRLAGVSSFGFSGTNAHLIIEEAPAAREALIRGEKPAVQGQAQLLLLSARSEQALRDLADRYSQALASATLDLQDVAFTAAACRTHFPYRLGLQAESTQEAAALLAAFVGGQQAEGLQTGTVGRNQAPRIGFLFTGQGAQYAGMGRQLYDSEPVYRYEIERCAQLLVPYMDLPLLQVLFPSPEEADLLDKTTYTQPALFALEWALAKLWISWGVQPYAALGHSVGELVAACLAGIFSLEDGLRLIALRGSLMGSLPAGGGMAAVFAPQAVVSQMIELYAGQLSIAAFNGPENLVVSGEVTALEDLLEKLAELKVSARRLVVSHAFHSARMDPILETFEAAAREVRFGQPQFRLASNLTGAFAGQEIGTPEYWRQHIRQPVLFERGLQTLYQAGCRVFIEIGPKPTLIGMARRCLPESDEIAWLPSLQANQPDRRVLNNSLAGLYARGCQADWKSLFRAASPKIADLPTYPFERQRCWVETPARAYAPVPPPEGEAHRFLRERIDLAEAGKALLWQGEVSLEEFPYLADHQVQGVAVLPATAYLEMVFQAAGEYFDCEHLRLREVENRKVMALSAGERRTLQLTLEPQGDGWARYRIYSRPAVNRGRKAAAGAGWVEHARGAVQPLAQEPPVAPLDVHRLQQSSTSEMSGEAFYRRQAEQGNQWGPAFQGLQRVWQGPSEALGLVEVPSELRARLDDYQFHPALADAGGHALLAALPESKNLPHGAFVGGGIGELRLVRAPLGERFWAHARLHTAQPGQENILMGDVRLYDAAGNLVSETLDVRLVFLDFASLGESAFQVEDAFVRLEWRPAAPAPDKSSSAQDWLVFSDRQGYGVALKHQLEDAGQRCILVSAGAEYFQDGKDRFTIRAGSSEDYLRLFQSALGNRPVALVYLRGIDAPSPDQEGLQALQAAHELCLISLQHILFALSQLHPPQTVKVWAITKGAQAVDGAAPGLSQAALWGLGRSLSLEVPETWGGMVDLDPEGAPEAAAAHILEAAAGAEGEDQVAYRGGRRFVARLVSVPKPEPSDAPYRCDPQGAYLITGGLGGLGLEVANWLADKGAAHLVLIGRSPLPEDWDQVQPGSRPWRQVQAIRKLQASGVRVTVGAVDVGDETQLRGFLEEYARAGNPPIRGVVHAAGIAQHQAFLETTEEDLVSILKAKVQGGWLLHQLVQNMPVDFFIFFSSASAVLNSPLAAVYAAANAFLDSLAHYRCSHGQPALSINWGFWAETGMVADFASGHPTGRSLVRPMSTRVGLAALEMCLAQTEPQIGFFSIDLELLHKKYARFASYPIFAAFANRAASFGISDDRPAGPSDVQGAGGNLAAARIQEAGQLDLLPTALARIVGSVLQIPPERINAAEPLASLGLDSLTALEIKNRVERDLKINIPLVVFLQGSSLEELVPILAEKLAGKPSEPSAQVSEPRQSQVQAKPETWTLSENQLSMWFLQQLNPTSIAYTVIFAVRVRSIIDIPALQRALKRLAKRHPVLQATFRSGPDGPQQVIDPEAEPQFEPIQAANWDEDHLAQEALAAYREPFDLENGPVIKARLFTRQTDDHLFMLTFHHIAGDAWSTGILLDDLAKLYANEAQGREVVLPEINTRYVDFIHWQQNLLESQVGEELLQYWQSQLKDVPVSLDLPIDYERPVTQTFNGSSLSFSLEGSLLTGLNQIVQQEGATLYTTLLAAFMTLLSSFSGQEDLLVGSPVSGRSQSRFEPVAGIMINMVALRGRFHKGMTFRQLLRQVRQTVIEALNHQDYPFSTLVEKLVPERIPGRSPLFQVTFDLQRLGRFGGLASLFMPAETPQPVDFGGLLMEAYPLPQQEGQFELGLQIAEDVNRLFGILKYNTDLFHPDTIQRIKNDYVALLEAIVVDPDRLVSNDDYRYHTMTLAEFLAWLRRQDIRLWLEEERLRASAPSGKMTPGLQAEISLRKAEIIAFLQKAAISPADQPLSSRPHQAEPPLSFAQQRLWFLDQLEPDNPAYNIVLTGLLQGNLDREAFTRAFHEVVRRHEPIRTTFQMREKQPVQVIAPARPVPFDYVDLRELPEREREGETQSIIRKIARQPFDLSKDLMLRGAMIRVADQEHIMVLVTHHIASDGWSMGVLNREIVALYSAFAKGDQSQLPDLPIQYADYAVWQRQQMQGEALESELKYWQKKLAGPLPNLDIPTDHPRPARQTFGGRRIPYFVSVELWEALKSFSRKEDVTLFITLLAAFNILLHRYTQQEDILVGSPVAGRNQVEIEKLIGFFTNNLVLRADLSGAPTFRELLKRLKQVVLEALAHQELPFQLLVESMHLERDLSRTPLFQVMFGLQNVPFEEGGLYGLAQKPYIFDPEISRFDLTVEIWEMKEKVWLFIEYNTDLFERSTIDRMFEHYLNLLHSILTNPDAVIGSLPLLSEEENRQICVEWNRTELDVPVSTMGSLFETQVERSPGAIAVRFEGMGLTYAELNKRANRLANYLRSLGVGPDSLVAIFMERSLDMLVGLLGIQKAGGAYLPLDPIYPKDRLEFMLQDSQAPIVLTQKRMLDQLPACSARIVCIDADWPLISSHSPANPPLNAGAENLAYVIYTSGSTGRPKGVQVLQKGLVNFLVSMQLEPGFSSQDILLAVTTLSFDIAGLELYLPIITGGCVVIASSEVAADGLRLAALMEEESVTVMQATPATWRLLLVSGWSGNPRLKVLCGGEMLDADLAGKLLQRCGSLWNLYGPTETTIWSTVFPVTSAQGQVPIGRPIANTQVYIVNAQLQPSVVGVPGELLIGGDGLARGYLNRPDLTAEKFIPNPFSDSNSPRLYRTGDLARYRKDGCIEFLGRLDHQVKIRGFRIELGEIEAELVKIPGIRQAVVVAREDTPGDKRLVAYIIPAAGNMPGVGELRRLLREKLPEYMVPGAFVTLEAFPLTPNGKVDRRSLPAPEGDRPVIEANYVAPRNETEQRLAVIWQELLNLKRVGVEDNFFDVGGHSLLLVQAHSRLRQNFQSDLTVAHMFQYPTIASLARFLDHREVSELSAERIRQRAEKQRQAATQLHNHETQEDAPK